MQALCTRMSAECFRYLPYLFVIPSVGISRSRVNLVLYNEIRSTRFARSV